MRQALMRFGAFLPFVMLLTCVCVCAVSGACAGREH